MARRRTHHGKLKRADIFGLVLVSGETIIAVIVLPVLAGGFSVIETTVTEESRFGMTIVAFFSALVGLAFTSMALTVARFARHLPMWMRVLMVAFPALVAVFGFLLSCAGFLSPDYIPTPPAAP